MRYILANWKMHFTTMQAVTMLNRLDDKIDYHKNVLLVLFPPFTSIDRVKDHILSQKNPKKFNLGVQNIYFEDEGAFTGEISAPMAKELADYVIIGHSERRIYFNENDQLIAKKMQSAIRNDLTPVLCIGENATQHTASHAKRVVLAQLTNGLANLTADEVKDIIIAYEPVWAIGTGKFAEPDELAHMIKDIRSCIYDLYGEKAKQVKLLYGGSVEADNASSYLKIKGCDGLLVGSASLNYHKFAKIVECATNLDL